MKTHPHYQQGYADARAEWKAPFDAQYADNERLRGWLRRIHEADWDDTNDPAPAAAAREMAARALYTKKWPHEYVEVQNPPPTFPDLQVAPNSAKDLEREAGA